MNTTRIILIGIVIVAIVVAAAILAPGAREAVIGIIVTMWREIDRGTGRPGTRGTGGGSVLPMLLVAGIAVSGLVSCASGQSQVITDDEPEFEGGELVVSTDGNTVEMSAEASATYRMVHGQAQVDAYYSEDRQEITALMSLTVLQQIGAALLIECEASTGCELCILSGKSRMWCHSWRLDAAD